MVEDREPKIGSVDSQEKDLIAFKFEKLDRDDTFLIDLLEKHLEARRELNDLRAKELQSELWSDLSDLADKNQWGQLLSVQATKAVFEEVIYDIETGKANLR